jgi:hypothetical protein
MLAPPSMEGWAMRPVYLSGAERLWIHAYWPCSLRRSKCNVRIGTHACWPSSLRRLRCKRRIWTIACWPWSLRQVDCHPKTWIRHGLLALLPSALIIRTGLVYSMTLRNERSCPSRWACTRFYTKAVSIVVKVIHVD